MKNSESIPPRELGEGGLFATGALSDTFVERGFFVGVSLWTLLIFAAWPVAQHLFAGVTNLRIAGIDQDAFGVLTSWLPLAAETARGNLFPASPSLGQDISALGFYPYITLWIHGAMVAVFGLVGAAIVGGTLWPTAAFVLLVALFRQYVPRRWAVSFAAVGSLGFLDFPFRNFLMGLASGSGWRELGIEASPNLAHFPIPALTVTLFLACLLISLARKPLNTRRLTIITVIWALQSQIHPVNAAIGLVFWFGHFPLELYRRNRGVDASLIKSVSWQLVVALVVLLPALAGWYEVTRNSFDFLGRYDVPPGGMFGAYYYFAYFLLPLALTGTLYLVTRLDYYELLTRFRPIYALMLIEFFLVSFNLATGRGIPAENLFSRLALYVLHPLYYAPIIHFLTRLDIAGPASRFSQGVESSSSAGVTRRSLYWFTMEASKVYLPLLLLALTAYALASAQMSMRQASSAASRFDVKSVAATETVTRGAKAGEVVGMDLPSANLLPPVMGRFGTLWVSRFSNAVERREIVARLALYAKLAGWSRDGFQDFMAPVSLRDLVPISLDEVGPPRGIGYWLAFLREVITSKDAINKHRANMARAFDAVDINGDACRFGLTRWLAEKPPPPELDARETRNTPQGRLYMLDWDATSASRGECPIKQ